MKTIRLEVATPSRRYPIHIGRDILADRSYYPSSLKANSTLVVSNETIAPHFLDKVLAAIGPGARHYLLPDGERYKSFASCEKLLDYLLAEKFGRDATLIALGGGVVGDLTGFVAAIYQRGIHFVQVPTTLLAQVDSSVGGKTAVNRPGGKNMVGAFHQPLAVITDLLTLETLPEREYRAGLAEVIKYGLLGDAGFFSWLEANIDALLAREPKIMTEAIYNSCAHKARIVVADERESGQRALLNLGHTFGHAIEAHLAYNDWLHGEAVACGMLMAAHLSCLQGWISEIDKTRVEALLAGCGLPVAPPPGLTPARMLDFMRGDKKNLDGDIRLVLLSGIGQARICRDYEAQNLEQTLEHFCSTPHDANSQLQDPTLS